MNPRLMAAALLLLCHGVPAWSQFPSASTESPDIPTQLILRLRSTPGRPAPHGSAAQGFGLRSVEQVHQRFAITRAVPLASAREALAESHPLHNVWIVEPPAGTDIEQLLSAYRALPEVVYAERDRLMSLFEVNDSLYHWQWALHNTGQAHPAIMRGPVSGDDSLVSDSGTVGADIAAHDYLIQPPSKGEPPVVAIIDTGVDPTHPELAGMLWRNPGEIAGNGKDDDHNGYVDDVVGWDHSGDLFKIPPPTNGDANPSDYQGHGTHVAGVVAARSDNTRGVAGVAGALGACRIMAVKNFPLALHSVSARAIVYAVDNGAKVISMSWGGPWRAQVLEDAVDYALASGVVLVAAAGNTGEDGPMYPAAYPGVIAVGATDHNDRVTAFSSWGGHISVVAPGLDILSLRAAGTDLYAPLEPNVHKIGTGYYLASGTSMAAPLVAGAVARLVGVSPGLSPERARVLLEQSAVDLVDPLGRGDTLPGRDDRSGAGRMSLAGLLALAPPEAAQIQQPLPNQLVTGTVTVMGTALGESGATYSLDFGAGTFPTDWLPLASGPAEAHAALLGEWHTAGLDGLYTLRLRVGDFNTALVRVNVSNSQLAVISSPAEGDSVVSWVELVGSASAPNFLAYLVELGESRTPSSWTVVHQGTKPVTGGLLTSWHSGDRPDGWYSMRLRVIAATGEVASDTVTFYLQSTFSTARAWKVPLAAEGPALVANFGQLDLDPPLEIVVGTPQGIRAFEPDGHPDVALQSLLSRVGPCTMPLAIGDSDGDGRDDLVAVNDSGDVWIFPSNEQIRAFRAPEPPILSAFLGIEEYILPTVFLKDIDGDHRDEIHYYGGFSAIDPRAYWVMKSDGSSQLKLSTEIFGIVRKFMEYLPADLDADGTDELYLALGTLYRLDQNRQINHSVPLTDSAGHPATALSLSAVDIDLDGRLELIVMAVTKEAPSRHVLLAFEDDLSPVPGWPRETGIEYFWTPSEPVFCDMDGDGLREYFISWFDTELGRVSAWRSDGTPLSGHATNSVWTSSLDPAKFRTPIATDLNADGQTDLLSCATEDMYLTFPVERIIAWDPLGQVLPGWPVILESGGPLTGSARRQTTSCGDVDRDGLTDVMMVTSENNLVFFNVPGAPFDSAAARVEFWRYNRSLNSTVPPAGPLRVESVLPTRLQADVPTNSSFTIGFNEPLEGSQLNSNLIEVEGSLSGIHAGSLHYNPPSRQLTFTPDAAFVRGDTVTVHVTSRLKSESGVPLGYNFATSFMVGAGVPQVINPFPSPDEKDVNRFTPLTFEFSIDVDSTSLADTTLLVEGNVHGRYYGSMAYDRTTRKATFTPDEPLIPAEVVTATLRPGVSSSQGILRDSLYSWSFMVAWPQPLYAVPRQFATGAPRSTYVAVGVDAPVPDFAVHDSTLFVYSETRGRIPGVVTFVPSTQSVRYKPDLPFLLGERLTAVTPSLRWSWSFNINSLGGPRRFAPPVACPVSALPRLVTAGDLDGDGVPELVAGRDESPYVDVVRRSLNGVLKVDSVLAGGSVSQAIPVDLDGDYDQDLVAVDRIGHSLAVLKNLGGGRLSPPTALAVRGILECGVHDMNADGHPDLYTQRGSTAEVAVLLGQGDGRFVEAPRLVLSAPLLSAAAFDADGDGHVDLITADAAGKIVQWHGDARGSFEQVATWNAGSTVAQLLSFNADSDEDADLAVLTDQALQIWRGEEGHFVLDSIYTLNAGSARIQSADFDADGYTDLVIAQGNRGSALLLAGTPQGTLVQGLVINFAEPVWSVAVADLDLDGDFDLAAGGDLAVRVAYYGSASDVSDDTPLRPTEFTLFQNYPNPFNPSTEIDFAVPSPSHVSLEVFNVLGRRVATLKNEVMAAGYYALQWDGRSESGSALPSGVYFYRLVSVDVSLTRRMMLLK